MHAMILAAGRGERLRPLTDTLPKPLIKAGGVCLIERQIFALRAAGIHNLVVNVCWLGAAIRRHLGHGEKYGVDIQYSEERPAALETAGGIIQALPLLQSDPFIVCNADIWTDFDYRTLRLAADPLAHLILVENPPHHTGGDFALERGTLVSNNIYQYTFAGIGLYRKSLFAGLPAGRRTLAPLLRDAARRGCVSGALYTGNWRDVGTIQQLEALRDRLAGCE